MKQLLMFALLCMGLNFASAQSLTIHNTTMCDVHYLMYGDDPMGNCGASYRSNIYTLNGGNSITYANPSFVPAPGMVNSSSMVLGAGGWFSHVRFPQCNPAYCPGCSTGSVAVGDVSCGASNTASHSFLDASCMVSACGMVNIIYTNVGGNVTVTIF